MNTLCVDLATCLGFAVGDAAGVRAHGSFTLPSTGSDIGKFLRAYQAWLVLTVMRWNVAEIIFESPILPPTTNLATCRKLYGLTGVTEMVAQENDIYCGEANLLDIRKHFLGISKAPKQATCTPGCKKYKCGRCRTARRTWIKDGTVTRCRALGFRPADDNDGDALALFSFVMSTRVPNFELLGTEIARAA